jgi:very-short-patch-repair endonuclease
MAKRWRTTQAIQHRARQLRRDQTPAEQKLWARLRRKQLYGLRFRRQHPIERFIVDFCCVAERVVVEIDGPVHARQVDRDAERTRWLEKRGYKVLRFTNRQVADSVEAVLIEIVRVCGVEE